MSGWIIDTISQTGYVGIFLLMLLESVFPPIPSELIIPFAGFAAQQGQLDFFLVIIVATLGSLVGMAPWYLAGRFFGLGRVRALADRFGRWFTLNAEEIDTATGFFRRFGPIIVLFGRLLPLIRTLISVPAGLARMPAPQFILYSTIGALVWNTLLAGGGYLLSEQYDVIEGWLDPVTTVVMAVIVAIYIWRLITWRPSRAR